MMRDNVIFINRVSGISGYYNDGAKKYRLIHKVNETYSDR